MKKTNSIQKPRGKIFIFVVAVLIVSIVSFWVLSFSFPSHPTEEEVFCSLKDPMFQFIEKNFEEWISEFTTQGLSLERTYPAFEIYALDGQYGLVRPYISVGADKPEFYIITESRWPGTQSYGARGYWYTPEKTYSTSSRMRYEYLKGDIYCYWFT